MAAVKQKYIVWSTIFLLYLASVCVANVPGFPQHPAATTKGTTAISHKTTPASTVDHSSASPVLANNTTRTTVSTQIRSLQDTKPSTLENSTITSASTSQDPTTTSASTSQDPTTTSTSTSQDPTTTAASTSQDPTTTSTSTSQDPTTTSASTSQDPTTISSSTQTSTDTSIITASPTTPEAPNTPQAQAITGVPTTPEVLTTTEAQTTTKIPTTTKALTTTEAPHVTQPTTPPATPAVDATTATTPTTTTTTTTTTTKATTTTTSTSTSPNTTPTIPSTASSTISNGEATAAPSTEGHSSSAAESSTVEQGSPTLPTSVTEQEETTSTVEQGSPTLPTSVTEQEETTFTVEQGSTTLPTSVTEQEETTFTVEQNSTTLPTSVTEQEETTSTVEEGSATLPTSVTEQEEITSTAFSPPTTTTAITTTTETDFCAGVTCENNGTCYSAHNNFTCSCTPGWQGPLCREEKHYCDPAPCQNGGTCTQNLTLTPDYFSCDCREGFTGSTCGQDVHECLNATICGNGICIELLGSYGCVCLHGWTGDDCQTDVNECTESTACPEYHHCNNTAGGHDCLCDDLLEYIDHSCKKTVLWPDFKSGSEFTSQTFYDVKTAIPFPYFESASRELFVYRYGYVAFGGNILSSNAPHVPSQWPFSTKLFGVYWADIAATDNSNNPSNFYFSLDEGRLRNVTYSSSLIEYVKGTIKNPDFEPLSVVAATWVNAVPKPANDFPKDKATFQVILATDGHVTYAVTGYRTVWENTNVYNRPLVQTVHSLTNGVQSVETQPESGTGPVVVKLVAEDKYSDPRSYECVQKTQDARARYTEDLRSLPPCPCYQAQAANDERFEVSSSSARCYHSAIPSPGNRLKQLCCFDDYGLLFNDTLPTPADDTEVGLEAARSECCTEVLGLCGWFSTQISTPGCGEYVPPFVGGGFGDPHFVTFDGNKYSYNGLGDFVIFKSGNTELQGRTNISNNNYTTVFVAFALKDGNQTYTFYPANDGVQLDNGITNTTKEEYKVVTSNSIFKVRNRNETLSYEIQLLLNNYSDSQGLLGRVDRNASNDFRFQNGTLKEGRAGELSADIINQFAESWRANKSLFGDSIDYPNFTSPVLETTPDAVLRQINATRNQTGFDDAERICKGELFCLQDYLIEGDPESAKDTLEDATDISNQQDISKELPRFDNTQDHLQVNASQVLNLTLAVTSSSKTYFNVSGNFSKLAGFELEANQLTWNISADLETLRNVSYPQSLKFYVTNERQLSAEYSPIIMLCLCEKASQCSLEPVVYNDNNSTDRYLLSNDGTSRGNVGSWTCNCGGQAGGEFCEKEIDVCSNCFVKDETLCNKTLEDYCPPCPAGHEGNKFLCLDIDECAKDNGGCKQVCNNLDGSFNCSCNEGFRLSRDGHTCFDINECLDKTACEAPQEYCINTPGSYHCVCYPGLVGAEQCILAPYTFYGSLGLRPINDQQMSYALLVKSSQEFQHLAGNVSQAITEVLVNSSLFETDELYVEVLSFENDTTAVTTDTGNKNQEAYTLVHYLIHSADISVNDSVINNVLFDALNGCNTSCQFGNLVLFPGQFPAVDDRKDLCTHQEVHHCDPLTSECEYNFNSHETHCNCKTGFTRFELNLFSCYDTDECANNANLCGPGKGSCINLPGGYECNCGKGKLWNSTTKACVGDKCSGNPCENDGICFISDNDQGFVCSCTYGWNGPVCADEDTDARRMKIAVICVAAILGFCCLALFIIVVVVCLKQRRISKETSQSGHYTEIRSASHSKVTQRDSNEMEENGRGNVYSRPSFERISDQRTSFHSPNPETKKDTAKVYYNKAFDNDVVARL